VTKARLLVAAGVLVVAVLGVLAYPAWSAAQGGDARWVVDSGATVVLDYDDERVLMLDGASLVVLDRATGEESAGGRADFRERAALVPGGVLASFLGHLTLTGPDGRVVWEKKEGPDDDLQYALEIVDVDAGVVVADVEESASGPSTLMGFALADGAPVWTMPEVVRVGTRLGPDEPARPPGWQRTTALLPVVRAGGDPADTAVEPRTWSLVRPATGEVAADVAESHGAGMPVALGDVALQSRTPDCADLAIIGGPEVRWPGTPPAGECDLAWLLDPERAVLTARADPNATRGGDAGVQLYALALRTGEVTELDWTGSYADVLDGESGEMTQSWGRYLRSRDAIYDTETGEEKWRAESAWLAGDTAVVAEPVTGLDWLATGAPDDARWLRLADAATGEPTDDGYLADVLHGVEVLDRGQAVVYTGEEVALLG
jgi:hypothetical protein